MTSPIIFYDPTSEPSRAVHWFCLEAGIPHELQYVWLSRGEHMSAEFKAVNPLQKVPALKHGDFCLSEATAIMQYLADINDIGAYWFGHDIEHKAVISQHLSWYHTNLRQILTLDYFLSVLLMPAYLGIAPPNAAEVLAKTKALDHMLGQLDSMLEDGGYLSGPEISAADLLFATELCALNIDPSRNEKLAPYANVRNWQAKLQELPGYGETHKAWDHVVPMIRNALIKPKGVLKEVTRACEDVCE